MKHVGTSVNNFITVSSLLLPLSPSLIGSRTFSIVWRAALQELIPGGVWDPMESRSTISRSLVLFTSQLAVGCPLYSSLGTCSRHVAFNAPFYISCILVHLAERLLLRDRDGFFTVYTTNIIRYCIIGRPTDDP